MQSLQVILLLFISISVFAQRVTYNPIIDSTDTDTKAIIRLFENYLASHPKDKKQNPYWNLEEQQQYRSFDFLEGEFQPSLYMGFPVHVLSIKFKDSICQIKAQFSYCKEDGSPYVLAIANYIAIKENGNYRLKNWLSHHKDTWECTTVGIVDFYYPPYHHFNLEKAQRLNSFINQICQHFGIPPKAFEYYLADDYDEIQQLKGFDYYLGMGGKSTPRGKATNDKVYCGGLGEYYPHEVFHLLVNDHFPDQHFWVAEGVATLLGGSRGKSLDWHIKRANTFLQKHPEVDLGNMLKLRNLDSETSYHYVLGGLIARKILEKGSWELLKKFMSIGKRDEDYYQAIEQYLGVHQSALNSYIRKELTIASTK